MRHASLRPIWRYNPEDFTLGKQDKDSLRSNYGYASWLHRSQCLFLGHSEHVTSFQVFCVLIVCVLAGMLVLVKFSLDGQCALSQNRNCQDNDNQQSKRNRYQTYIRQLTISNIIDKHVITSTIHRP